MSAPLTTACDGGVAAARRSGSASHPNWTIAATMLASSVAFIDGSVTNVALPAISRDLGGGAQDASWIINAYLLPLASLLLMGGAAGDHFGRRRILVAGICLFAAASVACALASSIPLLLLARGIQGLGAALLMPTSLGILGSSFSGEARGRAVGTWSAAGAIASAVGPPLGGWLVETVGWRSILLLNVPVGLAAIVIALRYLDDDDDGTPRGPLDWRGAALATSALGALTWALTAWASEGRVSTGVTLAIGIGAAILALFVWAQHRSGEHAMMPLTMFASRPFVGLTLMTLLLYGALGGLVVLLPYLLQVGGGYTPVEAGLALLPFSVVIGAASRYTGRLVAIVGARWPLSAGPIVVALGFLLLLRADPQASYWLTILPGVTVLALGMAGAVAPLTTTVLSSVDEGHTGTASGFNSAIARTGGLITTALAGGVLAQTGSALLDAFHVAVLVAACLAAAAGAIALATLPGGAPPTPVGDQDRSDDQPSRPLQHRGQACPTR